MVTLRWMIANCCPRDERMFSQAACHVEINIVKWVHRNKYPRDEDLFVYTRYGNLDNIK
jgi:hypothetical protein